MKCELVKENIILANYGELPDEFAGTLEQHLDECDDCRREWDAMRIFQEKLALLPVIEPSPNLLAQSRMRLDDALDLIPPHGFLTRFRSNFFAWVGHVQGAPALATLLVGVGFLGGNFTYRYQVAHQPKPPVVIAKSDRFDWECNRDCADAELRDSAGEVQPRSFQNQWKPRWTLRRFATCC